MTPLTKQLHELLGPLPGVEPGEYPDTEITGIANHSGKVEDGHLFAAIVGTEADGHDYIPDALERGAEVLLVERETDAAADSEVTQVVVDDTRSAWALVCKQWFNCACDELSIVGITGTNGKTSTALLAQRVLERANYKTGLFGTLGAAVHGEEFEKLDLTTPDPFTIHRFCHRLVEADHTHLVAEISSHALEQKRTAGIEFDAACFTNLSQDHYDYHDSPEAYRRAKFSLFTDYLAEGGTAVVNLDDAAGRELAGLLDGEQLLTYGTEEEHSPALFGDDLKISFAGNRFSLHYADAEVAVASPLVGRHNVLNALGAAGIGLSQDVGLSTVKEALESVSEIPGRLEPVEAGQPFRVLVDYAHTPDALENVLQTLDGLRSADSGRIITVFGCGGDRDRDKRGPMGIKALTYSDVAVITSDNPRSEEPEAIIQEIVDGLAEAGLPAPHDEGETVTADGKTAIRVTEREDGIARAIREAETGDTVLIAGKGHEDYQILGDRTRNFDDREVAREKIDELAPSQQH